METLSIGEVAARAGVAASTIRYYERIGLLPRAPRLKGRRRYAADIVEALALVRLGQAAGFTLAELREIAASSELPRDGTGGWQAIFRHKLAEVRGTIARLAAAEQLLAVALECDCADVTSCSIVERLADSS